MLTKVLLTAAAAALISTAAYAQQNSATAPTTVNPILPAEPETDADDHVDIPAAPVGQASDVVAINADEARARGIPVEVVASAPVPDTPENRRAYGQPMSNAGKNTAPRGN